MLGRIYASFNARYSVSFFIIVLMHRTLCMVRLNWCISEFATHSAEDLWAQIKHLPITIRVWLAFKVSSEEGKVGTIMADGLREANNVVFTVQTTDCRVQT